MLIWMSVATLVVLGAGVGVGLWIFNPRPAAENVKDKDSQDKQVTSPAPVDFGDSGKKRPPAGPPPADPRIIEKVKEPIERGVAYLRKGDTARGGDDLAPQTRRLLAAAQAHVAAGTEADDLVAEEEVLAEILVVVVG